MNTPQVLVIAGAVVISALVIGRYSGGNRIAVGPAGPSAIGASIDLVCDNMKYTVETGNDQGTCDATGKSAGCVDGKGNSATASCANGCQKSNGSGKCSASKL